MACPSAGQCTAVDEIGREVTFDPGAPGTPIPVTVDNQDQLSAIACPSATQCTAVDENGLAVTFDPVSVGAHIPVTLVAGDAFSGVACPSAAQCTAVDDNGREVTFAPRSSGARSPVRVDGTVALSGIACPSAGQCTAVGSDGRAMTFDPTPAPRGRGSLRGVGEGRPRLEFWIAMGSGTPRFTTLAVALPKGLAFARASAILRHAIVVRGSGGERLRFSAHGGHGTLTIELRAPVSSARVSVARAGMAATRAIAQRVRARRTKAVTVVVMTSGMAREKLTLRLPV